MNNSNADGFSHLDEKGQAQMVDISAKSTTTRKAIASGKVTMQPQTLQMIMAGSHKKGDVLATARIAGIMAAKQTHHLIPMCHSLQLSSVKLAFEAHHPQDNDDMAQMLISATCVINAATGVEMEALTAVSVTALTLYDMCKAVDKAMVIGDIMLEHKSGGKSGTFERV